MMKKDLPRALPRHQQAIDRTWQAISGYYSQHGIEVPTDLSQLTVSPHVLSSARVIACLKLLKFHQQQRQRFADID
eukprot:9970197-Karenia_brevis.AAC.1